MVVAKAILRRFNKQLTNRISNISTQNVSTILRGCDLNRSLSSDNDRLHAICSVCFMNHEYNKQQIVITRQG